MSRERLSMRKTKEMLRLHFECGLTNRKIAASVSVSPATVFNLLQRFDMSGLNWPEAANLPETELESRLYPQTSKYKAKASVDVESMHRQMKRKGVTLQLLWQEYKYNHPDTGYGYTQFCEYYRRFRKQLDVVLRQDHHAGEKMFVDFSGDGIKIVNRKTGEVRQAELFVAVLGASNYTYAEAFESQESRCWVMGHIHAFEYFGGVTEITVPDNTRCAVIHPCLYEPDINRTYAALAKHYDTAVIPARKKKPRDKAKVESAVLLAQRWILAALRNHTFFSIQAANQAIFEKLEELNRRKFQKLNTTRRELFETLDKPALKPLPINRFEYADWLIPRVNVDYHVEIEKHYYSVPYQLIHKKVDARITSTTVELFFRGKRLTSHRRSYIKGGHTTLKEHMPKSHQEYVEWTPERIQNWAGKAGPMTEKLVEKIMASKKHPQQGFRACLGVMRLGKAYGSNRLEAACERALAIGSCSYKSIKSILKSGLDRQPLLPRLACQQNRIEHENIRGRDYYH